MDLQCWELKQIDKKKLILNNRNQETVKTDANTGFRNI